MRSVLHRDLIHAVPIGWHPYVTDYRHGMQTRQAVQKKTIPAAGAVPRTNGGSGSGDVVRYDGPTSAYVGGGMAGWET